MALQVVDEPLAAVRVGIAAVHEAVHIGMLDAVGLGYVAEFVEVVDRRVHAAVRHEAHEVHVHAFALAYSKAAFTSAFSMIEPSLQARLIFTKS